MATKVKQKGANLTGTKNEPKGDENASNAKNNSMKAKRHHRKDENIKLLTPSMLGPMLTATTVDF